MAIYHFSCKVVGRTKVPNATCTAAAAYRSGTKIGEHDYTRKEGVVWSSTKFPEGCPEELRSREALWSAMDAKEKRKDAQLYRDVDFAFPNQFSYKDCQEVLEQFAEEQWTSLGMCSELAIHDPQREPRNLHGHAMLSLRTVDEKGIGKKNRDWNEHDLVEKWREAWEEVVNARLKEIGDKERIDHRSNEDQGKRTEPTKHEGKVATWLYRRFGIVLPVVRWNQDVRARNAKKDQRKGIDGLINGAEKKRINVANEAEKGRSKPRGR